MAIVDARRHGIRDETIDADAALEDQLEAGCVHVMLPHVVLTVEGPEVPPLQALSDKQLSYARAVRASAVHGFLSMMLARGAKLPRSNVEEQMPMLAGWVQALLRAETERRYGLDGQARGPGHRRGGRGLPRSTCPWTRFSTSTWRGHWPEGDFGPPR